MRQCYTLEIKLTGHFGCMKSKLFIFLATIAFVPFCALAGGGEGFTPLVGIPGLPSDGSFDGYVDALYALAISIAALVAVVKIILAGAKYMMDDIVTHKSQAKEDIKNALIGLLIIIGAVIILNTVNSDLTNLDITAQPIEIDNTTPSIQIDSALSECEGDEDCVISNCSTLTSNYAILGVDYSTPTQLCNRVCDAIGGTFIDSDRGCLYSQDEYTNALDEQRSLLETSLCPNGDDYICTVQPCLDDSFIGSLTGDCSAWCNSNGNLNYSDEEKVCYSETLRDGVFERRISDRLCPEGDVCSVNYCFDNDANSYCNRGDDIFTFSNSGACENLQGIYDTETDTCLFIETDRR
jgi:Type IV secretion system pilin